jgi:hypothetical protein
VKATVLIATTSRWFPTARLAMALANAGCTVDAVCPAGHPLGKMGAVRRTHAYHGLVPLKSFANAVGATQPDLIVPGDDLATCHLHRLHEQARRKGQNGKALATLIERSLGAPGGFPVVYARTEFIRLARKVGVRAPRTEAVASLEDLRRWAGQAGFPTVLKANGTSGGDGVRVVHDLEEAEQGFHALQAPPLLARAVKRALVDQDKTLIWPSLRRRQFVVNAQEFVAGREATSAVAAWQGKVLASLHFEVINKRDASGPSSVLRLIENAEMSFAAETMVREMNLSGLHGFDFMLEADGGNAHLIEINPRATQVGHLALGPGHDLPAALYSAISGEPLDAAPKVTENDIITLFPQEWMRDPASPFLLSGYHDVPWEDPELIRACCGGKRWRPTLRSTAKDPAQTLAPGTSSTHMTIPMNNRLARTGLQSRHFLQHQPVSAAASGEARRSLRKPVRVMKFGGTSVGDASAIGRVVEIIRNAARDSHVVVVVSAMSGVTNKLVAASNYAEAGDYQPVAATLAELRRQHDVAADALIHSAAERSGIRRKVEEIVREGDRLCHGTMLLGELTPRTRDAISSLGERLSAPLVAAALAERGVIQPGH